MNRPSLAEANIKPATPAELPAKTELRAIDCTTTKDWEQWARERVQYEDPYGPIGGRY